MTKKWQVTRPISEETKQGFPEVDPVVLQLMFSRGFETQEAMDEFLRSDWSHDVHDPFLFRDMNKAVNRIYQAQEAKEKVLIFGDYDADGVTGSAILYKAFRRIGFDKIDIYIPHRESEGYGLNPKAVKKIKDKAISLVITVDLGITEIENIKSLREAGIDVIIVDHHEAHMENGHEMLPEANAIIHASLKGEFYPYKHLCGAGTAFKLAQAVLEQSLEENEAFEKWLLDLAAIGTVADMVPLTGENRTLVKYGLVVLSKTQNLGLKKLIEIAGISKSSRPLSSWNIGFQIAPRINAAGRISHAKEALELLLTENETEAEALALRLNKINKERQKIAEQINKAAKQLTQDSIEKAGGVGFLIAEKDKNWPVGLVGLAAGRLSNEYYRPVLIMTEVGGFIKGSARSIPEFHVTEALQAVKEHLASYGGHEGAAGFSLPPKNYDQFIEAIQFEAEKKLKDLDLAPTLSIDMEVDFASLNWELAEAVEEFEPFGESNQMPLFLSKKLKVVSIGTVGAKDQHLRLTVSDEADTNIKKAIGFGLANGWVEELKVGDKIDIVYELGFNEWNGNRELQIKLKDLKKSYE